MFGYPIPRGIDDTFNRTILELKLKKLREKGEFNGF